MTGDSLARVERRVRVLIGMLGVAIGLALATLGVLVSVLRVFRD